MFKSNFKQNLETPYISDSQPLLRESQMLLKHTPRGPSPSALQKIKYMLRHVMIQPKLVRAYHTHRTCHLFN